MINTRRKFAAFLDRRLPSEEAVLFFSAILVGAGTALGAVLFIRLIQFVEMALFEWVPITLPWVGRWWIILIPVIGALIAGPVIHFFAREAKGHGVPEVMQAIALQGGRIRPRVVVSKVLASAACIGSGGSAGREGPIVQVGAALGSSLGQIFHFSEARIKNLVACGAAAGIAATFNAPIAGVMFSLEIILGELRLVELGSVLISAVIASVTARSILGDQPAFNIPNYAMNSPIEIVFYVLLGVIAAVVGVLFIRVLYRFEDLFDEWRFPEAFKPAVGALLLGLVAFIYPMLISGRLVSPAEALTGMPIVENIPHIFGAGFEVIEQTLVGQHTWILLLLLVFLKILATSLTLGSGNSGGVFAPGLFVGAMTGGVFGHGLRTLFPGVVTGIGPYATVGMAAVFSAAARAPLTAILIVFEMTDDYRIIVPLMAAVMVATFTAQRMHPQSIYTLKLVRRGIRLLRGRVIDVMEAVRVKEVMDTRPPTVDMDFLVCNLPELFIQADCTAFPVLDQSGRLAGIVSLTDYRALANRGEIPATITVADIATMTPVCVDPEESVRTVLERMAPRDLSRLPVVSRTQPKVLMGTIRRHDIIKAYRMGMLRKHINVKKNFEPLHGMEAGTYIVPPNSNVAGKTLQQICLPRAYVVVGIEREGETIMPHGDTMFQVGDLVSVLSKDTDVDEFERILAASTGQSDPSQEFKESSDCGDQDPA